MTRCQSWRRGAKPHPTLHQPGKCHKCWRPCRQKADEGNRCVSCTDALVHAPEAWVRLALVSEESPSPGVVDLLVGDGDVTVNYTAHWQRAHATTGIIRRPEFTPSLRENLVASATRETQSPEPEPFVPRYAEDDDQDDW
jgi:hypothetical protein